MIGRTVQVQRLIMAALQPLTGDRAAGTALVKTVPWVGRGIPPTVTLPRNCYAYPVPESEAGVSGVDDQRIIRTDGEIIATPDGVEVPVTSLLGGARHNALTAGTELKWEPPVAGLESHSRLVTDMSGATDLPEALPWYVREVTSYEDLAVNRSQDLFRARLQAALPAIVITWQSSVEGERKGKGKRLREDVWFINAVTDNLAGEAPRRDDALFILDAAEKLLSDRYSVDGAVMSAPPARVMGRRRFSSGPSFVAKQLTLRTFTTVTTIDLRFDDIPGMTAQELNAALWRSTSYTLQTTDEPPAVVVRGVVDPRPQGAFSDEFSDEFDVGGG